MHLQCVHPQCAQTRFSHSYACEQVPPRMSTFLICVPLFTAFHSSMISPSTNAELNAQSTATVERARGSMIKCRCGGFRFCQSGLAGEDILVLVRNCSLARAAAEKAGGCMAHFVFAFSHSLIHALIHHPARRVDFNFRLRTPQDHTRGPAHRPSVPLPLPLCHAGRCPSTLAATGVSSCSSWVDT